jgi:hypothetical protein
VLLLIPRLGLTGALVAMAVSYGVASVWIVAMLHRRLGVDAVVAVPRGAAPLARARGGRGRDRPGGRAADGQPAQALAPALHGAAFWRSRSSARGRWVKRAWCSRAFALRDGVTVSRPCCHRRAAARPLRDRLVDRIRQRAVPPYGCPGLRASPWQAFAVIQRARPFDFLPPTSSWLPMVDHGLLQRHAHAADVDLHGSALFRCCATCCLDGAMR